MIEKLKNILFAKPIFSVVGVFILLLSIVLGVYLVRQMTQLKSKAVADTAILSFVPTSASAGLSQEISFDVKFDRRTGIRAPVITGADLRISTDNSNISIVRFTPDAAGRFNTEITNEVGIDGLSLRYTAVNTAEQPLPTNQVVTLGRLTVRTTAAGSSNLRFDASTQIVASGYRDTVPLDLRTATVTVGGSPPSPSPSPSASPSAPPVSVVGDVDKNGCLNDVAKGGSFVGDPVLIWQMIYGGRPTTQAARLYGADTDRIADIRDYTTWWNIYTTDTAHRCQ